MSTFFDAFDADAAFSERVITGLAEDAGDRACDEAAVEAAPAFACGYLGDPAHRIYVLRANRELRCYDCRGAIQPDALFTSYMATPSVAAKYAKCGTCRPVRMLAQRRVA